MLLTAQTSANVTVNYVVLAPDNSTHAHVSQQPTLTEILNTPIIAANAVHAHVADQPTLVQEFSVPVQSATHAHTADNIALGVDLYVASAAHTAVSDNIVTNYVVLAPANAAHASVADNVIITEVIAPVNLVVANALHAHTAPIFKLIVDLKVSSCYHTILPVAGPYHEPLLGYISTPDPGPIPNAFIIVAKISNMLDVEVAHQANANGSGNFWDLNPFPMTYVSFLRFNNGWPRSDLLHRFKMSLVGGVFNQNLRECGLRAGYPHSSVLGLGCNAGTHLRALGVLLGRRQYLGTSQACSIWLPRYAGVAVRLPRHRRRYLYLADPTNPPRDRSTQ